MTFIKRRLLPLCFFLGISSTITAAEIVLPGDNFFPGWTKSGKAAIFIKADLFNHIDGGAELFLEFGFERAAVQRYLKGPAGLALEVYEMKSPESALGVYLMKCGRETPLPDVPARNSSETAQFTIVKGKYFILINNFGGDKNLIQAMTSLARTILEKIPGDSEPSRLFDLLPKEGRLMGSERLFCGPLALQPLYTFGEGDLFKLKGKIFGVLANYRSGTAAIFARLVIAYPDQKQALEAYQNLRSNLDPYLKITAAESGAFKFIDYRKKYGVVRLKNSLLEILINLDSLPQD